MKLLLTTLLMLFAAVNLAKAEEGMYPISEVGRLALANKGLRLTSEQIFNADQTCLVDGICKVNGLYGFLCFAPWFNHHQPSLCISRNTKLKHHNQRLLA